MLIKGLQDLHSNNFEVWEWQFEFLFNFIFANTINNLFSNWVKKIRLPRELKNNFSLTSRNKLTTFETKLWSCCCCHKGNYQLFEILFDVLIYLLRLNIFYNSSLGVFRGVANKRTTIKDHKTFPKAQRKTTMETRTNIGTLRDDI